MQRLALLPDTTKIENDSLTIAGHSLAALAEEFGTPLYIYDRATMDSAADAYRAALHVHYPAQSGLTYAGKSYLCRAIAQWTQQKNMWLDCTGEGEIAIAVAGGAAGENILVHGVNKSRADLISALTHAGTIVVDNLTELHRLADLISSLQSPVSGFGFGRDNSPISNSPLSVSIRRWWLSSVLGVSKPTAYSTIPNYQLPLTNIWLRLSPGHSVSTHHRHTQTGHPESKFGMTSAEIIEAAKFCKEKNLPLRGLHFHQGSNFRDPEPLIPAIDLALDLAKEIGFVAGWHLSPGGGWGVAYHEDELPHPRIEDYVRGIAEAIVEGCKTRGLPLPHLHLEPGRSIAARAGVAIYRVGAVKRRGDKTWLLTDGGLADNPRRALYGVRYSCLPVTRLGRENVANVSVAGPYCESGDVVIEDLRMPEISEGELIAIPVSGAYHLSMSSNYNGARRPAVVWLEAGRAKLIVRRETNDDLLARDLGL